MVSHWRLTYPDNIKRAHYATVGLITLVLIIAFGLVNGKGVFRSSANRGAAPRLVTFSYANLGAPPSLAGDAVTPVAGSTPKAPATGIPNPVADARAVNQTMSAQTDLVASSPLDRVPDGTDIRVTVTSDIPALGSYVPHNVNPRLVSWVNPEYPESAKLLGIEGRVYLHLLLDTDGTVMNAVLAKGSGSAALDTAAVAAGYRMKFLPAQQGDQRVRVWVAVPIDFHLDR